MASNKMDLKPLSSGTGIGRQTESQSSQETASIIELGGVIKSFDVSKGYGIIVLDNPKQIPPSCLRKGTQRIAS